MGPRDSWRRCRWCSAPPFATPDDFLRHLRDRHCSREGGSFVCQYGDNGVCSSLPLDGVAGNDYESHVRRRHMSSEEDDPSQQWTVYSAVQNLPAVLNDPNRAKRSTFFTRTWGDSFVEKSDIPNSPYLPDITHAHFDLYMKKIGKKYRKHNRIIAQCQNEVPSIRTLSVSSPEYDLSVVPNIFFKNDLLLNNSQTFNIVFPGLGETSQDSRTCCRSLQETLSHYLDIVEVQIAKQVSQKSDAFFHAMLSHDTIMEQMSSAVCLVKSLRTNITQIKSGLSSKPLKLINLATYRNNVFKVHEKLKLMSTVHQTQPMIQLLLSTADYVTALDLIGTTQSILSKELSGVHAFRHLSSQLNEMERLIDKMLNTEFQRFVTADLNRPFDGDTQLPDEDKLVSVISGLLRQKHFEFIDTYKEEAITTVQATVKQAMIEEISGNEGEMWVKGTGEGSSWYGTGAVDLLNRLVPRLVELLYRVLSLRRMVLQTTLVGDVALMDGEDFFTTEEQKLVENKLQNLINTICDYCLERCATLISTSDKEKASNITNDQMVKLSNIVESFSNKCEEISGRPCIILRTALKNQASRYIHRFHNERRNKLTLLLDNERWKQAEVPMEFQIIVDHIQENGYFPKINSGETESDKKPSAYLIVSKEPFTVVGVVLLAMRMIGEYCRMSEETVGAAILAGRALVELLRYFNSRCCQLVLGAGALQSAGLKTITTTNLALASRALQLLLWLLIAVRRHFDVVEINGALSQGFDSVEKDFSGHIREIELKLSNIVSGLLTAQLVNWEARPPVPSQQFRNVSRHLLKLHEALSGVLPVSQICAVYQTVHRSFKDKLREQLVRLNIAGDGGPQHGVVTSELTFYLQTLVTLQVLPEDDLGLKCMDEIWLK
ncbi:VPS54 subunit of GARP complex scat [Arctopsyche grandis]|uniref:VPS54 subunit of GARP complex scat n=1 Tax=Arctopsyche grandis TaxID=121162 RepID=UPI00406D706A